MAGVMPYYPTIDQDLARAREILERGKPDEPELEAKLAAAHEAGNSGTIYGADTHAAYMLLKSFVEHIAYLHEQQDTGERHVMRLEKFRRRAIKLNMRAGEHIELLLAALKGFVDQRESADAYEVSRRAAIDAIAKVEGR